LNIHVLDDLVEIYPLMQNSLDPILRQNQYSNDTTNPIAHGAPTGLRGVMKIARNKGPAPKRLIASCCFRTDRKSRNHFTLPVSDLDPLFSIFRVELAQIPRYVGHQSPRINIAARIAIKNVIFTPLGSRCEALLLLVVVSMV